MRIDRRMLTIGAAFFAAQASACVAGTGDEEPTASAASAETACSAIGPGTPCETSNFYLLCNSTGFTPNESTRLRPQGNGQYRLSYSVNQSWMVTNDSCRVVETNELGGWGTQNQGYALSAGTSLKVPATSGLGADGSFQVVYPAVGSFTATVTWGAQPTINIAPATASTLWEPVLNPTGHITSIATSPVVRDWVWVTYDDGKVFRTGNGTAAQPTWSEVDSWTTAGGTNHLPGGPITDIAVTPAFEDQAIVAFAGTKQGSKVWMSGPGGQSWVQVTNFPQATTGDILSVSINPIDNRVYVNGVGGLVVGSISGSQWQPATGPDPLKPSTATGEVSNVVKYTWSSTQTVLFVGTTVGEVFLSFNNGSSWMRIDQTRLGSPTRRVIDLAPYTVNLSKPGIFVTYEGMQTNANGVGDSVWKSLSGGQGWVNIHSNLPTTLAPTNIYSMGAISVNPADPTVLYTSFTPAESARSTDQGSSWTLSSP